MASCDPLVLQRARERGCPQSGPELQLLNMDAEHKRLIRCASRSLPRLIRCASRGLPRLCGCANTGPSKRALWDPRLQSYIVDAEYKHRIRMHKQGVGEGLERGFREPRATRAPIAQVLQQLCYAVHALLVVSQQRCQVASATCGSVRSRVSDWDHGKSCRVAQSSDGLSECHAARYHTACPVR